MGIANTTSRLAVAGALLTLTMGAAQAASVGASLSYDSAGRELTAGLVTGQVGKSDPAALHLGEDELPTIAGSLGYSAYMGAKVRADAGGEISASTSLRAGGVVRSSVSWMDSVSNQSAGGQNYLLNVALTGMDFSVGSWGSGWASRSGSDYHVGYTAEVLVDGVSVWHSAQSLNVAGASASVSKQGFDIGQGSFSGLGADDSEVHYVLGDYAGTVDLGYLAAGRTAQVSYTLTSFSYWDDPAGCSYECTYISSQVFDPAGISGPRIVAAPVPEPETYAMLLGGLGLLGVMARRRRATNIA